MLTDVSTVKWGKAATYKRKIDGSRVKALEMAEAFNFVFQPEMKKVKVTRRKLITDKKTGRAKMTDYQADGKVPVTHQGKTGGKSHATGYTVRGKKGDYLIKDSKGEISACAALDPRSRITAIFASKFETIGGKSDDKE